MSSTPQLQEFDWLGPEAREVLQVAWQEALHLQTGQVYPEHVLLAMLTEPTNTLSDLLQKYGISRDDIKKRIKDIFPGQEYLEIHIERYKRKKRKGISAKEQVPLFSVEVKQCIQNAVTLLTYKREHAQRVSVDLLALSIVAHPRIQKLLTVYSTIILTIQRALLEDKDLDFIRQMESIFLFSDNMPDGKRKVINFISVHHPENRRILKCVEYPDSKLQHIAGLDAAKKKFQPYLSFLHNPWQAPLETQGALLVGKQDIDLRQFVRAIAGEAGVPLTIVFCSVIHELFSGLLTSEEKAHELIREIFLPLKMFSYCLIYLDSLDILVVPDEAQDQDRYERILHYLYKEIDKLLAQPGAVLLAATSVPEHLPQELVQPERLGRVIQLDAPVRPVHQPQQSNSVDLMGSERDRNALHSAQLPAEDLAGNRNERICPACQKKVEANWRFCVFCSVPLSSTCSHCGTPRPEIPGARFCFTCGEAL